MVSCSEKSSNNPSFTESDLVHVQSLMNKIEETFSTRIQSIEQRCLDAEQRYANLSDKRKPESAEEVPLAKKARVIPPNMPSPTPDLTLTADLWEKMLDVTSNIEKVNVATTDLKGTLNELDAPLVEISNSIQNIKSFIKTSNPLALSATAVTSDVAIVQGFVGTTHSKTLEQCYSILLDYINQNSEYKQIKKGGETFGTSFYLENFSATIEMKKVIEFAKKLELQIDNLKIRTMLNDIILLKYAELFEFLISPKEFIILRPEIMPFFEKYHGKAKNWFYQMSACRKEEVDGVTYLVADRLLTFWLTEISQQGTSIFNKSVLTELILQIYKDRNFSLILKKSDCKSTYTNLNCFSAQFLFKNAYANAISGPVEKLTEKCLLLSSNIGASRGFTFIEELITNCEYTTFMKLLVQHPEMKKLSNVIGEYILVNFFDKKHVFGRNSQHSFEIFLHLQELRRRKGLQFFFTPSFDDRMRKFISIHLSGSDKSSLSSSQKDIMPRGNLPSDYIRFQTVVDNLYNVSDAGKKMVVSHLFHPDYAPSKEVIKSDDLRVTIYDAIRIMEERIIECLGPTVNQTSIENLKQLLENLKVLSNKKLEPFLQSILSSAEALTSDKKKIVLSMDEQRIEFTPQFDRSITGRIANIFLDIPLASSEYILDRFAEIGALSYANNANSAISKYKKFKKIFQSQSLLIKVSWTHQEGFLNLKGSCSILELLKAKRNPADVVQLFTTHSALTGVESAVMRTSSSEIPESIPMETIGDLLTFLDQPLAKERNLPEVAAANPLILDSQNSPEVIMSPSPPLRKSNESVTSSSEAVSISSEETGFDLGEMVDEIASSLNPVEHYPQNAAQASVVKYSSLVRSSENTEVLTLPRPRGIDNVGMSCFMSACLQAFLSLRDYKTILAGSPKDDKILKKDIFDSRIGSLILFNKSLHEFVEAYKSQPAIRNHAIKLYDDLYSLKLNPDLTRKGVQQDAEIFMSVMFESCGYHYMYKTTNTGVNPKGETISSNRLEPATTLDLEFGSVKDGKCLIEDMFKTWLYEKNADDKNLWECQPGVRTSNYDTRRMIGGEIPPPVLVVRLKRYSWDFDAVNKRYVSSKVKHPVTMPANDVLDLTQYMETSRSDSKKTLYKLVGIVTHNGESLIRGHYISYVLRDKRWYFCDDESSVQVSEKEVRKGDGYLYFFELLE